MTLRFLTFVTALVLIGASRQPALAQGAKVIVPHASWNCGMPDGIPAPDSGRLILNYMVKAL